jgi:2-polyprenyl-3-methyl-5-hydroxy-6-metoxy-1,4-benzoquinol methylase
MPSPIRVLSQLDLDHEAYDVSSATAVRALLAAEAKHFWHLTRQRIVTDRLHALGLPPGARLIDLGCGSASLAAALARAGYRVTGVEGHRLLLEVAAQRPETLALWLHDLRLGTEALPERDFDAAGLFDVIEHLEDPAGALVSALQCVRPGGWVVGTVPALMALWSGVDVASGHKTRYSKARLADLLGGIPGARVIEIAPFNRVMVPLLWLHRRRARSASADELAQNLSVPARPLNQALRVLVLLEHRLSRFLDGTPVPGASLWFALRRVE